MGLARHAVDVGLPYAAYPTLPYIGRRGHARLTVLRLPDNEFCSGRTVGRGYNRYCTKPLDSLSLCTTLHNARLVNLGYQV